MTLPLGQRFSVPYTTAFDLFGVVAPGAQLFFYATGTSTPVNTYSDAPLTIPNSNPVAANGAGLFPSIFLLPGQLYKVVLEDDNGNPIDTADPVFVGSGSQNFAFTTTVALLAAFGSAVTLPAGTIAITAGRTTEGDGGGGTFYYKSSDTTSADNLGTIRVDGANRRWYYAGAQIFADLFGTSTSNTAAQNTTGMNNIIASGLLGAFVFSVGTYNFNGPITWNSNAYPVGQGMNATFFVNNAPANDAFQFIKTTGDQVVRYNNPRDFQLGATSAGVGRGIYCDMMGNGDSFQNVSVNGGLNGPGNFTTIAFYCLNAFNLALINCRVESTGGVGVQFGGASNNANIYNLQSVNNAGDNLYLGGGQGISVFGADVTMSTGTGHGIHITTPQFYLNNIYIEGLPAASTGRYGIYCSSQISGEIDTVIEGDNALGVASTLIFLDANSEDVIIRGVKSIVAQTLVTGVKFTTNSAYNTYYQGITDLPASNSSSTSRVYQVPYNEMGVSVYNSTNQSITADGVTWNTLHYDTATFDFKSQFSLVNHTFTPTDNGLYLFTFQIGLTTNDATPASDLVAVQIFDNTQTAVVSQPLTIKGFLTGSIYPVAWAATLTAGDAYIIRLQYAAGSGSPTVAVIGGAALAALQVSRIGAR